MIYNNAKLVENKKRQVVKAIDDCVKIMGVEAVKFSINSFREQGWNGEKWVPRKIDIENPIARPDSLGNMEGYKRRTTRTSDNRQRAILVLSGNLKRSIFNKRIGKFTQLILSPLKYANIHNEGGVVTHPAKGDRPSWKINIPRRRFVGYSKIMANIIKNKLDKRIVNVFR